MSLCNELILAGEGPQVELEEFMDVMWGMEPFIVGDVEEQMAALRDAFVRSMQVPLELFRGID